MDFFFEFFLHIPCWIHFYKGSFCYTSRTSFIFIRGVSLTHPMLPSFLYGEFLLHIPCWLHFLYREFLLHIPCWFYVKIIIKRIVFTGIFFLHIPCWLYFYLGSFSDTSRAGFFFLSGVSLTHPVLVLFFYPLRKELSGRLPRREM